MSDIQTPARHYSFAHNMQNVLRNQVNELALLNAINDAMSTDKTSVTYTYVDSNGNQIQRELPAYVSLSTKVKALEQTINRLQTGSGYITSNGVKTEITIKNVPETPMSLGALDQPTSFDIDSNWFFEQFMFPGAVVDIDLTGKVSQKTTDVEVCRIILDSRNADAQSIWTNELSGGSLSYSELIARLNNSDVRYYEDRDTVRLPWYHNKYSGSFIISEDPVKKDGKLWYHLEKITYSAISEDGFVVGDNKTLTPGVELLYNGAVFKVEAVDATNKMIQVKPVVGAAWPGAQGVFKIYQDPSADKHVKIRFGVNEYNFIYIRPISPDYGIVANEWSEPIVFDSNNLNYKADTNIKFKDYYDANISDWGAEWVAQAKERPISAYRGVTPNAPTLEASDYKIVQINQHLDGVAQDTQFKQEYAELLQQQKEITAVQATVSSLKTKALTTQTSADYEAAHRELSTQLTILDTARSKYASLSDSILSKYNFGTTQVIPKYRVRGFIPSPVPVYINEDLKIPQEIIGYDIQYRYKTVNGDAIADTKYSYVNNDKSVSEATFSAWNLITTKLKTRVYNKQTNSYEWEVESVSDSEQININQIDLPITKSESIEFRVRAISEAGYPNNPLRSEWSNSVTITFKSDELIEGGSVSKYLETMKKTTETVSFQEAMKQEGLLRHIEDMYTVSGTVDTAYMHQASNIAYEDVSNGVVSTISMTDKVKQLEAQISAIQAKYEALVQSSLADKTTTSTTSKNSFLTGNSFVIYDTATDTSVPMQSSFQIRDTAGNAVPISSLFNAYNDQNQQQRDQAAIASALAVKNQVQAGSLASKTTNQLQKENIEMQFKPQDSSNG